MLEECCFDSIEAVAEAVERYGFLPFWENDIPGFSIEEHTPAKFWFSDAAEGPWEWKGPLITQKKLVYGKFFNKKACFMSRKWFYEFANYRRDGYDFDARFNDHLASYDEQYLYNIIAGKRDFLSRDIKRIGGYGKEGRKGFDTAITKLQMEGYVIASGFDYAVDKHGDTYGWGIARYGTAENVLGASFTKHVYQHTPQESLEKIKKHCRKVLPEAEEKDLLKLLK